MPRYHFNVQDGHSSPDHEGTELPDVQAARWEAVTMAGTMIEDAGKRARLHDEWRMAVIDEAGLVLFRLDFAVSESPAVKGLSGQRN
jgi:hypothetical protein